METSPHGSEGEPEPIRIPLGYDLFRARTVEARCEAAGLRAKLMANEHPETGSFTALEPSYLLVQPSDFELVKEIVEETYPSEH